MYDIYELNEKSLVELKEIALQLGIENVNVRKEDLVYSIIDQQAVHPDIITNDRKNDDTDKSDEVIASAEKPKKRGRKVATSRPDKKENANLRNANKETSPKAEQNQDSEENTSSTEAKPKREKRPRIGKRTDVVKTTINNDDESNKVQHVSYDKKNKKSEEKAETAITEEFVTETVEKGMGKGQIVNKQTDANAHNQGYLQSGKFVFGPGDVKYVDVNGDGVADLNIDTNSDGKPDINIDTNGDGIADVNVDTNGDGKPDINVDTKENKIVISSIIILKSVFFIV